jgi:hypothetical protein
MVPLLVLTGIDYALWDWSIADGHDIASLLAGLTLLPLAAVSLGGLVLTGVRLLGVLLARSGPRARARGAPPTEPTTTASAAQQESPSSRLAA